MPNALQNTLRVPWTSARFGINMQNCWICHKEFGKEELGMCPCCSLPESKSFKGDLCCFSCSMLIGTINTEKYKKKYGEKYWTHPDWGKK